MATITSGMTEAGYPQQAKAPAIPQLALILCVADSYDAMTTTRSLPSRAHPRSGHCPAYRRSGQRSSIPNWFGPSSRVASGCPEQETEQLSEVPAAAMPTPRPGRSGVVTSFALASPAFGMVPTSTSADGTLVLLGGASSRFIRHLASARRQHRRQRGAQRCCGASCLGRCGRRSSASDRPLLLILPGMEPRCAVGVVGAVCCPMRGPGGKRADRRAFCHSVRRRTTRVCSSCRACAGGIPDDRTGCRAVRCGIRGTGRPFGRLLRGNLARAGSAAARAVVCFRAAC